MLRLSNTRIYKTDELKVDNCNKSNYYILCRGYVFYTFYNSSYISEESIVILLNMDIYYYSTIEVMIMIILVCTTKYLLVFFGFSLNDDFVAFSMPLSLSEFNQTLRQKRVFQKRMMHWLSSLFVIKQLKGLK
jgi:hypothetical protein